MIGLIKCLGLAAMLSVSPPEEILQDLPMDVGITLEEYDPPLMEYGKDYMRVHNPSGELVMYERFEHVDHTGEKYCVQRLELKGETSVFDGLDYKCDGDADAIFVSKENRMIKDREFCTADDGKGPVKSKSEKNYACLVAKKLLETFEFRIESWRAQWEDVRESCSSDKCETELL